MEKYIKENLFQKHSKKSVNSDCKKIPNSTIKKMKQIDLNNRYQFQPWYVKLYRQVRYTPLAFVIACWTFITYPQAKLKKNKVSRYLMAYLVFGIYRTKLEHWETIEEAFDENKHS